MGTLGKWLILGSILLVVPLLTSRYLPEPFELHDPYQIKLFFVQLVYGFAVLVGVRRFCLESKAVIRKDGVSLLVSAFFLLCVASTLFSRHPHQSARELILLSTFSVGYFFCSQVIRSERDLRIVIYLGGAASVCVALCGLCQCQFLPVCDPYSTMGNRNFVANYLTLNLFPVLAAMLNQWSMDRRGGRPRPGVRTAVGGLAIGVLSAGIYVADSLGALLGVVAGFLSVGYIVAASAMRRLALVALSVWFAVSLATSVAQVRDLMTHLFETDPRVYLWGASWAMLKDHFWWGPGLGTFFINFPDYRSPRYFSLKDVSAFVSTHAHNELLQLGTEMGIWGILSFVAIFVLLTWKMCRLVTSVKDINSLVVMQVGLYAGLVAVLTHDMFSVDLRYPSMGISFWAHLGLLVSSMQLSRPRVGVVTLGRRSGVVCARYPSMPLVATAVLLLASARPIVLDPFLAEHYLNLGVVAESADEAPEAANYYRLALQHQPHDASVLYHLGNHYFNMGAFDRALEVYERLQRIAPQYSSLQSYLGGLYLDMGRYPEAIETLSRAVRANPYDASDFLRVAEAYERMGTPVDAQAEMEKLRRTVDPRTRR